MSDKLDLNDQCLQALREYLDASKERGVTAEDAAYFGCPMGMNNSDAHKIIIPMARDAKRAMLTRMRETVQAYKELALA